MNQKSMLHRPARGMLATLACCLGLATLSGCHEQSSAIPGEVRDNLLLDALPAQVLSLAEAHGAFVEGEQVSVVGRIFADTLSPFDPDAASFSLIELPKPGHDHENPGDCPFCKHEMENAATAIVHLVDEADEVLAYSAEQLLDLTMNQDVVVQGKMTKVGDMLIIRARSLHKLADEKSLELAKRIHG